MKVKIFDEENEKDLEESVNNFLEVSCAMLGEEQIYCFSAMIVYY